MSSPRIIIERLLAEADIAIDGPRPWDIEVHNGRFFSRVLAGGTLALGESYMDGSWDCPALDPLNGSFVLRSSARTYLSQTCHSERSEESLIIFGFLSAALEKEAEITFGCASVQALRFHSG